MGTTFGARAGRVLLVGALTASAGAAAAQDGWPDVREHRVEACDGMQGVTLYAYGRVTSDPRWNRYVLGDTCYSRSGGWHRGYETLEGLVVEESYGPFSTRFTILEDGERRHERRSLVVESLVGPDQETPLSPDALASTVARVPWRVVEGMEGADALNTFGYVFSTPRVDLDALPAGLYVATVAGDIDSRLEGADAVEPRGTPFANSEYLLASDGTVLRLLGGGNGQEPASFDLSITSGRVGGSFTVGARNPGNPIARDPREYDTGELEIRWINGHVIEADGHVILVGVGAGRSVLRHADGATDTEDGWARLEVMPVPEGVTPEMLSAMFEIDPADL